LAHGLPGHGGEGWQDVKRASVRLLWIAAGAAVVAPQQGMTQGPPPAGPPPYQMRAPSPAGDRLAGSKDGQALFSNRCGSCHLAGGMGTNMLTKLRVAAGEPPASGLLANRTDLTQTYVKSVVRHGIRAMPRLTRVEVTDAELDAIAQFLGKAGK
jgi:mono/diheme cytochrome c family protein